MAPTPGTGSTAPERPTLNTSSPAPRPTTAASAPPTGQPPFTVRLRPPEPHPGLPQCQPAPEGSQGRQRVAASPEPVLVRRPDHTGPPEIRPHHRPGRGRGRRPDPRNLRVHGHDHAGTRYINQRRTGAEYCSQLHRRRERPGPLRRQRQRPYHLRRGPGPRHRAGPPRPPGIPVHARRRRGRRGVRVSTQQDRKLSDKFVHECSGTGAAMRRRSALSPTAARSTAGWRRRSGRKARNPGHTSRSALVGIQSALSGEARSLFI